MLTDRFSREHDYLRISITDRCDLRCIYCIPADGVEFQPRSALMTDDEIVQLSTILVGLGIRKIRITGGEPLVRPKIESLLARLSAIEGLDDLAVSTNGTQLEEKLSELWASGVRKLNVSLDSLRPKRFLTITGKPNFGAVLSGIRNAVLFQTPYGGFDAIRVNVVVIRGVNDDELVDFIHFGAELSHLARETRGGPDVEVRFIEFMPFDGNGWDERRCLSYVEMRHMLEAEFHLEMVKPRDHSTTKSFYVIETNSQIGFITSMTDPFCQDCSRLRLTADGTLRTCLFSQHVDDVNLLELVRAGASVSVIGTAIRHALESKWQAHPPPAQLAQLIGNNMVSIGG